MTTYKKHNRGLKHKKNKTQPRKYRMSTSKRLALTVSKVSNRRSKSQCSRKRSKKTRNHRSKTKQNKPSVHQQPSSLDKPQPLREKEPMPNIQKKHKNCSDSTNCVICSEPLTLRQNMQFLRCAHSFHHCCISLSLQYKEQGSAKCPECKVILDHQPSYTPSPITEAEIQNEAQALLRDRRKYKMQQSLQLLTDLWV
jgi:DNA segregation ATPase FtsK/SpoIIIE-like protein